MELQGRVALVTGAGVRVGRAIAAALAREGARVAAHYNSSRSGADALVKEIQNAGGDAHAFGADFLNTEAPGRLVDDVASHFGALHILVNSAATMERTPIDQVNVAHWEGIMTINLRAPFFLALAAARVMRESAGPGGAVANAPAGAIINISDLAALETWPEYIVHGISKAGIEAMTKSLARVLAPAVRVNAIAPGAVLLPDNWPENEARKIRESTPLRRIGSAQDVADTVVFLIRSDYITGTTVIVDGGRNVR